MIQKLCSITANAAVDGPLIIDLADLRFRDQLHSIRCFLVGDSFPAIFGDYPVLREKRIGKTADTID